MRTMDNFQAINALMTNNFNPEILERYSGYGGIGKELAEYKYYKKLNAIVPKEEIAKIKATIRTAYYTPPLLVRFIYRVLERLGFKGGNILEPSAGNGVFFKYMPEDIRKKSKMLAIEPEPYAFRILKALYPDISAINKKFEEVEIKNNCVDLIIGNPPYGGWFVNDKNNPDLEQYAIHHYFTSRGVRLLKKGGILAFVMDCYFMDNLREHVRYIIKEEGGSLLASYRMPDNLFDNAKVTVDIVFIIKEKLNTKWHKARSIRIGKETKPINEYYIDNPGNILGKLAVVDMYDRTGLTCKDEGNIVEKMKQKLSDVVNGESSSKAIKEVFKEAKIQTWITNIICKEWDKLLDRIEELKRAKPNWKEGENRPKIKISTIKVELIKTVFCFKNNTEEGKQGLLETALSKEKYYYEISIVIKSGSYPFSRKYVEGMIEEYIKGKIKDRFQYKVFCSFK